MCGRQLGIPGLSEQLIFCNPAPCALPALQLPGNEEHASRDHPLHRPMPGRFQNQHQTFVAKSGLKLLQPAKGLP